MYNADVIKEPSYDDLWSVISKSKENVLITGDIGSGKAMVQKLSEIKGETTKEVPGAIITCLASNASVERLKRLMR
ncbi:MULTISPECIES: hypothetical protein [Bacillus]|uniref:Uncharacterized protein n=1 Tax=Bacillus pumilus TaxID=1408 RepID=A0A9Q9PC80_BACPU|nr:MULTISPECIES: hypothetical protein [Bacillus]MEE3607345.1 hypothetical protein [Bacillus altitudinis]MCY7710851.1 hypothetical protein [Bacillus safensis]MCY7726867.1 hypothetical protein [Bacillus safensis]MED4594657.1 hypothetical protein [Bacillus safensis]MED4639426.1 hypothetical protein [Bacillus safensis]